MIARQIENGYAVERRGLYLTTQRKTAEHFAETIYGGGINGGPATLEIRIQLSAFNKLASKYGIGFETAIDRMPSMTETFIPKAAIPEFNSLIKILQIK